MNDTWESFIEALAAECAAFGAVNERALELSVALAQHHSFQRIGAVGAQHVADARGAVGAAVLGMADVFLDRHGGMPRAPARS